MPELKKKPRKPRVKKAPAKSKSKKGLKQKQKQRQEVNVNVSAGGSGGGGYVPIPQAPSVDYALISQLLRPAATVDMPIRAAAPMIEAPIIRPAEPVSLAEELPAKKKAGRPAGSKNKPKTPIAVAEGFVTEEEPLVAKTMKGPFDISRSGAFSKSDAEKIMEKLPVGTEFITSKKGKKLLIGNPDVQSSLFELPDIEPKFGGGGNM